MIALCSFFDKDMRRDFAAAAEDERCVGPPETSDCKVAVVESEGAIRDSGGMSGRGTSKISTVGDTSGERRLGDKGWCKRPAPS